MAHTCALCGGRAGSPEHIYGKWWSKFINPQRLPILRVDRRVDGERVHLSPHGAAVLNYRAFDMCEPCNQWMARAIEGPASALLKKMTREHVALSDADLDLLAAYAYKSVLMAELDPLMVTTRRPDEVYREFRRTGEPGTHTSVVLAHFSPDEPRIAHFRSHSVPYREPQRALPGVASVWVLGPVAFSVVTNVGIPGRGIIRHIDLISERNRPWFISLWPRGYRSGNGFASPTEWPPTVGWLDASALEDLEGLLKFRE